MQQNRVKAIRTKLGLSQQRLAEIVHTSQQQIQRLETGKVPVRLELAVKLSKALNQPIEIVFPGSSKSLKVLEAKRRRGNYFDDASRELADSGLEADPRTWYFKFLLRGHSNPLIFQISFSERLRLFRAIQHESESSVSGVSFVLFEAEKERIALNLEELVCSHFLHEYLTPEVQQVPENFDDDHEPVEVYFCGSDTPLTFGVDSDEYDPKDGDEMGQFNHIFFLMECFVEKSQRYYFLDEDGEDVFLRAGDIALLKVPLGVVEPNGTDDLHEEH